MKRKRMFLAVVILLLVAASTMVWSGCPYSSPWRENTFTVYNESSLVVMYVYLSPCSSPCWGVDQLGSDVIPLGESFTISDISDDCYDFLAIAENDDCWEYFGFDISGGGDFWIALYDDGGFSWGEEKSADAPELMIGIGIDGFEEGKSSSFQTGQSDFLKE